MQPPALDPVLDLPRVEPQRQQLPPRHDAVLPAS
jgi:hypothetical protein